MGQNFKTTIFLWKKIEKIEFPRRGVPKDTAELLNPAGPGSASTERPQQGDGKLHLIKKKTSNNSKQTNKHSGFFSKFA